MFEMHTTQIGTIRVNLAKEKITGELYNLKLLVYKKNGNCSEVAESLARVALDNNLNIVAIEYAKGSENHLAEFIQQLQDNGLIVRAVEPLSTKVRYPKVSRVMVVA